MKSHIGTIIFINLIIFLLIGIGIWHGIAYIQYHGLKNITHQIWNGSEERND